jgi:hypothetical protein
LHLLNDDKEKDDNKQNLLRKAFEQAKMRQQYDRIFGGMSLILTEIVPSTSPIEEQRGDCSAGTAFFGCGGARLDVSYGSS